MKIEHNPPTQAELDALKVICEKATNGPWNWTMEDSRTMALYGPRESVDHVLWSSICPSCADRGLECTAPSKVDADFISAARTELPRLIAEVERLRGILTVMGARNVTGR